MIMQGFGLSVWKDVQSITELWLLLSMTRQTTTILVLT